MLMMLSKFQWANIYGESAAFQQEWNSNRDRNREHPFNSDVQMNTVCKCIVHRWHLVSMIAFIFNELLTNKGQSIKWWFLLSCAQHLFMIRKYWIRMFTYHLADCIPRKLVKDTMIRFDFEGVEKANNNCIPFDSKSKCFVGFMCLYCIRTICRGVYIDRAHHTNQKHILSWLAFIHFIFLREKKEWCTEKKEIERLTEILVHW